MTSISKEPRWLSRDMVNVIHARQLDEHGGFPGINDEALIESALSRPQNKRSYAEEPPSLTELAAAYGFGLAKNHGFRDGNKRTAFMAMYIFLGLNGLRLVAEEPEIVQLMEDVASGVCSEDMLAVWLDKHTSART
ncbi:MAG: type II toxin-antitoxin system death-on-curing family toxin [Bacteroidetes bacterium]|jgi:death-on-curing protein|nr:type II toxin-antitoxin system death-on-curing family toxin [Bacteroidota bacterium]